MPSMMEIHDSLVIHSACRADAHPGMSWHVNKVSMQLCSYLRNCKHVWNITKLPSWKLLNKHIHIPSMENKSHPKTSLGEAGCSFPAGYITLPYHIISDHMHDIYLRIYTIMCSKLSLIGISVSLSKFVALGTLRLGWMGFEYQHQLSWHGGCAIHRGEWCSSLLLNVGCGKFDGCEHGNHIQDLCEWWLWSIRLPMKIIIMHLCTCPTFHFC